MTLRIICTGAMLCLCALAWFARQAPAAEAAGVPFCGTTMEHAPTRQVIHLNRREGPAGTNLTVTASGWHPGAQVTIHFDARDPKTGAMYVLIDNFWLGTADAEGRITSPNLTAPLFFCVQDTSSGAYNTYKFGNQGGTTAYFVLTSDHGEVSAPVAFTYLPAPVISLAGLDDHGGVKVGSTLTVTGSGWEPDEPLSLTLFSADPASPGGVPDAARTHAAADTLGNFATSYLVDAQLRWNTGVMLVVEGNGPRFGYINENSYLTLLPAIQPTFQVDRTLVTPGMEITVSGEHWYPGDTFTIKFCNAHWQDGSWVDGPNCGKESNPALGTVTVDADGRIDQQFTMPNDGPPRTILVRVNEVTDAINVHPIPVQVVDHLPTWDDIHPRVAALRNRLVGSLPFTIPAALALGALAFFAIRRWRVRRPSRA